MMKCTNRFISIGLGVALAFTSTYFIEGIFTDKVVQKNIISLLEQQITVDTSKNAYFYNKHQGRFHELYIPIKVNGLNPGDKVDIDVLVENNSSNLTTSIITSNGVDYIKVVSGSQDGFETKLGLNIHIKIHINNVSELDKRYHVSKFNNGNDGSGGSDKYQSVVISEGSSQGLDQQEPQNPEDETILPEEPDTIPPVEEEDKEPPITNPEEPDTIPPKEDENEEQKPTPPEGSEENPSVDEDNKEPDNTQKPEEIPTVLPEETQTESSQQ